jgi:hypothetical protein
MRWSERRTAVRSTFEMTSTLLPRATRGLVRRRSSYSVRPMTSRLVAIAMTFLGAAGCSTVPQIPKRDYAHTIIGSWQYAATHSGESIQKDLIVVFRADGRLGVRARTPRGFGAEDIIDSRWRVDGDRLMMTRTGRSPRGSVPTTERIISFTNDEVVTISEYFGAEKISVISQATHAYKRIQQQRDTPNQTMQRTATRRSPQISHD